MWTECEPTRDGLVGRRGGAYEKRPEHFDGRGCALLAERECDIILMDELGRMELDAHAFRAAVLAAINSGTPVLGVIKPEHNAFLDEVRAQNGVELFPLTIENRPAGAQNLHRKSGGWPCFCRSAPRRSEKTHS